MAKLDTTGLTAEQADKLAKMIRQIESFPYIFGVYGSAWFKLKAIILARDDFFPFCSEPDPHAYNPLLTYHDDGTTTGNKDDGSMIDFCWEKAEEANGTVETSYTRRVYYPQFKTWEDSVIEMTDTDLGFPKSGITESERDFL